MSANSTTNELFVKYGGALSGTYTVNVFSSSYGQIASTVTFQAIGTITSFSPSSGSVYGGTLLTINGYTFSSLITDNPVMIGAYECPVISSSANSITCLTPLRPNTSPETDIISVFLKTSEEATCSVGGGCNF